MSTIVEFDPSSPSRLPTGRYAVLEASREQFFPLCAMRGIQTTPHGMIGKNLFMYNTSYPVPASWTELPVEELLKGVY